MSGGADGHLNVWEDVSEEVRLEKRRAQQKRATDTQKLANLIDQQRLFEALEFTLDLGHPFQWALPLPLTILNK